VIPLLDATNVTAAAFAAATLAGLGALCFHRLAGLEIGGAPLAACVGIGLAACVAATGAGGSGLVPGKGVVLLPEEVLFSEWNNHSNAIAMRPRRGPAFYWGAGEGADRFEQNAIQLVIDGGASTWVTEWDGDPQGLEWVRYDVTYLPHALRRGKVAVIGVGGGRDVLSAIAGGSESITGLEVNGILVDWLTGPLREFAHIADHPGVRLIHDEARSYLTRTEDRFDVIQMSLIDTWAATGAGAFALTENGLYTLEAWRLLLARLTPNGVLGVSRWFSPIRLSETNRLVVLGVAALLDRGIERPGDHLVLVSRDHVATLLVSPSPFSASDLARVDAVAAELGLRLLLAPGRDAPSARFAAIVASANEADLLAAAADPVYDFTPPTDERPYFFNMLRAGAEVPPIAEGEVAGVTLGNIRAAETLRVLVLVSIALAALIVLAPLARLGLPGMSAAPFAISVGYFAGIGFAYMLLQFALLQRFSVLLGHPTYSLAVVLFAMILFTGVGSLFSDRVRVDGTRAPVALPLLIAGAVALLSLGLPAVFAHAIGLGLAARVATVVALTAPLAILLGFCFPFGLRMVTAVAPDAGAWMWGVNGAFSVLGSVSALMISMAWGIDGTFTLAALTYAALVPLALLLSRAATRDDLG